MELKDKQRRGSRIIRGYELILNGIESLIIIKTN